MHSLFNYHIYHKSDTEEATILYLHGFMGAGSDWRDIIEFSTAPFSHLVIDLPGHGNTPVRDDLTFEQTAESILYLLNTLNLNTVNLVGYSMGGRLALYLTVRYPHRFKRIVIESASPGLNMAERMARKVQDEQLAKRLEKEDFGQFLDEWYSQPLFADLKHSTGFKALKARRLRNNPKKLSEALGLLSVSQQPSLWNRLAEISQPLLLITGERDSKYLQIAKRMMQINPAFNLKLFNECGHNCHAEKPDTFSYLVEQFFTDY